MSGLGVPASFWPLDPPAYLECVHPDCSGHRITADELTEDIDPCCDECRNAGFYHPKTPARSAESQWGAAVMKHGFTMPPNLLSRHARTLGIKPADLGLMVAFLSYENRQTGLLMVSHKRISAEVGMSEKRVGDHCKRWVDAGLWERKKYRRRDGSVGYVYSLRGLRAQLDAIARGELEPQRSERPLAHGQNDHQPMVKTTTEPEGVEPEGQEPEPLTGVDRSDRRPEGEREDNVSSDDRRPEQMLLASAPDAEQPVQRPTMEEAFGGPEGVVLEFKRRFGATEEAA